MDKKIPLFFILMLSLSLGVSAFFPGGGSGTGTLDGEEYNTYGYNQIYNGCYEPWTKFDCNIGIASEIEDNTVYFFAEKQLDQSIPSTLFCQVEYDDSGVWQNMSWDAGIGRYYHTQQHSGAGEHKYHFNCLEYEGAVTGTLDFTEYFLISPADDTNPFIYNTNPTSYQTTFSEPLIQTFSADWTDTDDTSFNVYWYFGGTGNDKWLAHSETVSEHTSGFLPGGDLFDYQDTKNLTLVVEDGFGTNDTYVWYFTVTDVTPTGVLVNNYNTAIDFGASSTIEYSLDDTLLSNPPFESCSIYTEEFFLYFNQDDPNNYPNVNIDDDSDFEGQQDITWTNTGFATISSNTIYTYDSDLGLIVENGGVISSIPDAVRFISVDFTDAVTQYKIVYENASGDYGIAIFDSSFNYMDSYVIPGLIAIDTYRGYEARLFQQDGGNSNDYTIKIYNITDGDTFVKEFNLTTNTGNSVFSFEFIYGLGDDYPIGTEKYYMEMSRGLSVDDYIAHIETHTVINNGVPSYDGFKEVLSMDFDTFTIYYDTTDSDIKMKGIAELFSDKVFDIPFFEPNKQVTTVISGNPTSGDYTFDFTPQTDGQEGPTSSEMVCFDQIGTEIRSPINDDLQIAIGIGDGVPSGDGDLSYVEQYGDTHFEVWDTKHFDITFIDPTCSGWDDVIVNWDGDDFDRIDMDFDDCEAKVNLYGQFVTTGNFTLSIQGFSSNGNDITSEVTVEVVPNTKLFHIENGVYTDNIGELQIDFSFNPTSGEEINYCDFYTQETNFEMENSWGFYYPNAVDIVYDGGSDIYTIDSDGTVHHFDDSAGWGIRDTWNVSGYIDTILGMTKINDEWYVTGQTDSAGSNYGVFVKFDIDFNHIETIVFEDSSLADGSLEDFAYMSNGVEVWLYGSAYIIFNNGTAGHDFSTLIGYDDMVGRLNSEYGLLNAKITSIWIDEHDQVWVSYVDLDNVETAGIMRIITDFEVPEMYVDYVWRDGYNINGGSFYYDDVSGETTFLAYERGGTVQEFTKYPETLITTIDGPITSGLNFYSSPLNDIQGSYNVRCELTNSTFIEYQDITHWYNILVSELTGNYYTDENGEIWLPFSIEPQTILYIEINDYGWYDNNPYNVFYEYDGFDGDYNHNMWAQFSALSNGVFIDDNYLQFSALSPTGNEVLMGNNEYPKSQWKNVIFEMRAKSPDVSNNVGTAFGFADMLGGNSSFGVLGNTSFGNSGLTSFIDMAPINVLFDTPANFDDVWTTFTLYWKDNIELYADGNLELSQSYDYENPLNRLAIIGTGDGTSEYSNLTMDYVRGYFQSDYITVSEITCDGDKCYVAIENTADEYLDDMVYNLGVVPIGPDLGFQFVDEIPITNLIDYTTSDENKLILGLESFVSGVSRYLKIIENSVDSWASTDNTINTFESFDGVASFDDTPYFVSSIGCCGQTYDPTFTGSSMIVNQTFLANDWSATYVSNLASIEMNFRITHFDNIDDAIYIGLNRGSSAKQQIHLTQTNQGIYLYDGVDTIRDNSVNTIIYTDGEWHKLKIIRNGNQTSFYIDSLLLGTYEGIAVYTGEMYPDVSAWDGGVVEIDSILVYNDDAEVNVEYSEINNTELILNLTSTENLDANVFLDYYDLSGDLEFQWSNATEFSLGNIVPLQLSYIIDSALPNETQEYTSGDDTFLFINWTTTNPNRELVVWKINDDLENSYYTSDTESTLVFEETVAGDYVVDVYVGEPATHYTWNVTVLEAEEEDEDQVVVVGGGGGGSVVVNEPETETETSGTEISIKENDGFFSVLTGNDDEENVTSLQMDRLEKSVIMLIGQTKIFDETLYNTLTLSQDVTIEIITTKGQSDWIVLQGESLQILASDEAEFRYEISVPEDVETGDYEIFLQINGKDESSEYKINIKVMPKEIPVVFLGIVIVSLIIAVALTIKISGKK